MIRRAVALLLLIAASPILIVVVVGVQYASSGSVFYKQARVGLHGRIFRMWKLRTMVPNAEKMLDDLLAASPAASVEWTAYGRLCADPRIAGTFGRWARRLSFDELPQLINVLRGEMALVGPRPLPVDQAIRVEPSLRRIRESVLPGMTGLWQVCGRSDTTLRQMIKLDLLYIRRRSALLNLKVICRTPRAVLSSRGAY